MSSAIVPVQSEAVSNLQGDFRSILRRAKLALDTATEISVSVEDIRRYEDQPRKYFNPAGIRSLANSIAAGGQTTSGLIHENPGSTRYELIDGERRWRAIYSIAEEDRPEYKAKLIVADDDVIKFLIAGVSNFNREGHTALETMETIVRLLSFEFPMEEIAVVLGISTNWAYQIHGLSKLVPEVQNLLDPNLPKKQQLPVTAAIQISKMEKQHQAELARRVISREVSLARLRPEVVTISKKAGSSIRLRETDPKKKLESAGNKASVLLRNAEDLRTIVSNPELKVYMTRRPTEVERIKKNLSETKALIDVIEKDLENN